MFQNPLYIDGLEIHLGVSIGVKIFPDGTKTINDIIIGADAAMYKAKENGKNQFVFYNEEIEKRVKEQAALELEIKQALEKNEFIFYYQPKVSVATDKVIGAELLLRWNHPTKGILYPEYFMDIVKNLKKGAVISYLALEEACRFIEEYKVEGTISINIGVQELVDDNFINKIIEMVIGCQIDISKLEFEILENELIVDFEKVSKNIEKLHRFGIKFSIDDFGTGYSSLSYLSRLNIDTVKIDRYFIQNLDNYAHQRLIKMIVELAESFDFKVVIEGVERREQLSFVKRLKVDAYQGFLFSKAVVKEKFIKILEAK
jgi:EAL domain-containing protein (putative c-di-GMP-specific phosphodiesterase class I)